jgi:tetratricopeptide (TPR) repeat protein
LRAAISWSYDLLGPSEAAAACAFSVFEGSLGVAAAAAVLGEDEDDALLLIDELVLKSMLAVVGGSSPVRYAMMSTVREYLRDVTADEGKLRERKQRHFQYFAALVTADPTTRPKSAQEWLQRVDADITDVRAAVDWAVAELPAEAAAMVVALSQYWKARGFLHEGRSYFRRLLALPALDDATRARLLRRAASFAIEQDDYDDALAMNLECRRIYEQLGDANGVAETFHNVALIEQRVGHVDAAAENYDRAVLGFRASSNAFGEALALHNLTLIAFARDDFQQAEVRIDEAAPALARASDAGLAAHFTVLRGRLALERGDFSGAESYYREALAVQRRIDNRVDLGYLGSDLALVLTRLGRYDEALASARDCLRIALEVDSSALLIYGFEAFCEVAVDQGRYEDAARYYALAGTLRRTRGYAYEAERDMTSIERTLRGKLGVRFDAVAAETRSADIAGAAKDLLN